METETNQTLEILKIVVPACAALLGALLAGVIALVTSIWTSRVAHKNALEQSKRSIFNERIIDAHKACMEIATRALLGNCAIEAVKSELLRLSVWLPQHLADDILRLKSKTDGDGFHDAIGVLIEKLRQEMGTE